MQFDEFDLPIILKFDGALARTMHISKPISSVIKSAPLNKFASMLFEVEPLGAQLDPDDPGVL